MTPPFSLENLAALPKKESILESYEKTSGSKINLSKSQMLWGVTYKNRTDKPIQIAWSQFSIKIVGVHF